MTNDALGPEKYGYVRLDHRVCEKHDVYQVIDPLLFKGVTLDPNKSISGVDFALHIGHSYLIPWFAFPPIVAKWARPKLRWSQRVVSDIFSESKLRLLNL